MRYFEEKENNHTIVKIEVSGKDDEINTHLRELGIDPCEVSGVFCDKLESTFGSHLLQGALCYTENYRIRPYSAKYCFAQGGKD